jgi:hypothetical protein
LVATAGFDKLNQRLVATAGFDKLNQRLVATAGFDKLNQRLVATAGFDKLNQRLVLTSGSGGGSPLQATRRQPCRRWTQRISVRKVLVRARRRWKPRRSIDTHSGVDECRTRAYAVSRAEKESA